MTKSITVIVAFCLLSELHGQVQTAASDQAEQAKRMGLNLNQNETPIPNDGFASLAGRIVTLEEYFSQVLPPASQGDEPAPRDSGQGSVPKEKKQDSSALKLSLNGDNAGHTYILLTEFGFQGVHTVEDAYLLLCDDCDIRNALEFEQINYASNRDREALPVAEQKAYNRSDRHREEYSNNDREQVRGPESANNHSEGSSNLEIKLTREPVRVYGKFVKRGNLQAVIVSRVELLGTD